MALFKKDSLLTNILLMVAASVVLVFILIFGLDLYTRHGKTVTVPDLRGKTVAEMKRILDEAGLDYEINDSTFSRTAIPGTVREVFPEPGSQVKAGRILFIAINGYHQRKQTVPNYKDQSARQILALLKGLGFESVEQRVVPGGYVGSVVGLQTHDGCRTRWHADTHRHQAHPAGSWPSDRHPGARSLHRGLQYQPGRQHV